MIRVGWSILGQGKISWFQMNAGAACAVTFGLIIGGCASRPNQAALDPTVEGRAMVAVAEAGESDDNDVTTEVVEQRSADGTLLATAEGWRDEDGVFVHHGAYTVYWENGQKKSEVYYRNGEYHGPRTSWYSDGTLWKTGRHEAGRPVGAWIEYHPNGHKAREMTFVDGGLNGPMIEWYPDGQIMHRVTYVNGLRQGRETRWDSDGALLAEEDYIDDVVQP